MLYVDRDLVGLELQQGELCMWQGCAAVDLFCWGLHPPPGL